MRSEAAGELLIGLKRSAGTTSLEATLRLEPIGSAPLSESAPSFSMPPFAAPEAPLTLLAHVAMRGDLRLTEGEWAGGPQSPAPIEGLAVLGEPALEIQTAQASRPLIWSDWRPAADFSGTRGRRLTLGGVRLRLRNSNRATLTADALFLGAAVSSKRGSEIEFVGAGPTDPLVGFRIARGSAAHA